MPYLCLKGRWNLDKPLGSIWIIPSTSDMQIVHLFLLCGWLTLLPCSHLDFKLLVGTPSYLNLATRSHSPIYGKIFSPSMYQYDSNIKMAPHQNKDDRKKYAHSSPSQLLVPPTLKILALELLNGIFDAQV